MTCKVYYDEKLHVIENLFTGIVKYDELVQMFYDVTELAIQKKCYSWIHDFSNAERQITQAELYKSPKMLSTIVDRLGDNKKSLKRAIVGKQHMLDLKFAVKIYTDLGFVVQAFDNIDHARDWITGREK